jgi:ketosteroid isomerase-like protein
MAARVFAFLVLLASAAPVWAADASEALVALEHRRSEAIAAHDEAFLSGLYADDFRGVTALGIDVDKTTLLGVFARADGATRFTLDDLQARLFGDTAVVTGRLTGRDGAGALVSQSRYMHVYVRRGGRWLLVAGEATELAPERRG